MIKNAVFKGALAFIFAFVLSVPAFAQLTASEEKAANKSIELYKAGKYDKAISTLSKVQDAHIFREDLWKLRVTYENERYTTYRATVIQKAYAKAQKSGGEITINDPKLNTYRISMLVACLQATMYADNQADASAILRRSMVDPDVDTAIGDKAKEHYDKGDEEYSAEHWNAAIKEYKKAMEIDSNYYNAAFSIGLAYRKNEDYTNAIPYFRQAARIAPGRALPYQFIADCYMELKEWENAKNAAIDGILIYPEVAFFDQLGKISEKLGKTFNRHWGIRIATINDVTSTQSAITNEPWSNYRAAKDRIADYCNDAGVITKKNSITEQKYLEAYSWEQMIKKSNAENEKDYENFGFAKDVMKDGYIDCYAFISVYHVNLHDQYKDFAKNNADRVRTYINTYLMK